MCPKSIPESGRAVVSSPFMGGSAPLSDGCSVKSLSAFSSLEKDDGVVATDATNIGWLCA